MNPQPHSAPRVERSQQLSSTALSSDSEVPVGTFVLIPRGLEWRSTHPKFSSGVVLRDIKIKVQTSSSKWDNRLTWAGTGGYWKWVDKSKCFLLS
jgi:hypothetical protein